MPRSRDRMDWEQAHDLSTRYGDSFFVMDFDRLRHNVLTWRDAFRAEYPDTDVAYPYKVNNLPPVCRAMAELGARAEVCSAMEWGLARHIGLGPERVVYNGSGRPAESLATALVAGATVVIDSERDARILAESARSHPDRTFGVGIRCDVPAPDRPGTRLGLAPHGPDWDRTLAILTTASNVHLTGLHCHMPGGDPAEFARRITALLEVAAGLFPAGMPGFLDIGGGFYGGVPAHWPGPGPEPTPADYARAVGAPLRRAFEGAPQRPSLWIEPGSALVATTMTFVSRVMDVKSGPRGPVAVVAGSIFHTSPNTRRTDFPVRLLARSERDGRIDVAGASPMPDEWLALQVDGSVAEGDFIQFRNVGAYSVSVRTVFTHPSPAVLGRTGTRFSELMPAGTADQILGLSDGR